ncbi:MAG: DUF4105 domain-containing protein [Parcubacteria group bacterium]
MQIVLIIILLYLVAFFLWLLSQEPKNDRHWEKGQEKLARIKIRGAEVTVENFRDFDWQVDNTAGGTYKREKFDLEKLQGVDVIISHFSPFEGLAHTLLSFRFSDKKNLAVSVETRKVSGEEPFSIKGWLFSRRFELIYVVGSEKDILGVRTGVRKERVYLYPTVATPRKAKELFLLLAKDINNLYANPTFYNTFLNNCTNALTRRVEDISEIKFPLTYKTILPGYIDEILYKIKLIPCDKPFAEIKKYYRIDNDKVDRNNVDYSEQLRKK